MALPANVQGGTSLPNGDYRLPNQDTPNWTANPSAVMYYNPAKGLYYNLVDGVPKYHASGGPPSGGGFLRGASAWDRASGTWKRPINFGNLMAAGIGTAIGAPFVAGAFGAEAATTAAGTGTGASMASKTGFLGLLKKYGPDLAMNLIENAAGAARPVGQTAGAVEAGRAKSLVDTANIQQRQDQLALQRYRDSLQSADTEVAQRLEGIAAPGKLAGTSVRGDILAGAQDAQISDLPAGVHMGTVTGGLRPSLLSGNSRQLGANMSRQALADQMSGKYTDFKALPDVPEATPLPKSNAFDTALQGVAIGGGFLDALKGLIPAREEQPTNNASPVSDYGPVDTTQPPGGTAVEGLDPELLKWLAQQSMPPTPPQVNV